VTAAAAVGSVDGRRGGGARAEASVADGRRDGAAGAAIGGADGRLGEATESGQQAWEQAMWMDDDGVGQRAPQQAAWIHDGEQPQA